jgi:serine/threonine-protein kinase HipA
MQEMFRRMAFNVVARNQDDHTRNIAFLMDKDGLWRLSPAFDVIWAHNPAGEWTNRHQMSVNGKRDHFTKSDILAVAKQFGIKGATEILAQVMDTVARWQEFADEARVSGGLRKQIAQTHRVRL